MNDKPRYEFELPSTTTCVVVVDMQNDFCAPDGFFASVGVDVSACLAIVPQIQRILAAARAAGLPILYTRMSNSPDAMLPLQHRILPGRDRMTARTAVCVTGTSGAEIVDELAPEDGDLIVDKSQYSAFFKTELEDLLSARGIDTVVVTGATTNVCVDSFVRDAYFRAIDVVVVGDAVASYESSIHDATLTNIDLLFGAVSDTEYVEGLIGAKNGAAA
jgi:ureidoacrylate peracid hydrolase